MPNAKIALKVDYLSRWGGNPVAPYILSDFDVGSIADFNMHVFDSRLGRMENDHAYKVKYPNLVRALSHVLFSKVAKDNSVYGFGKSSPTLSGPRQIDILTFARPFHVTSAKMPML